MCRIFNDCGRLFVAAKVVWLLGYVEGVFGSGAWEECCDALEAVFDECVVVVWCDEFVAGDVGRA